MSHNAAHVDDIESRALKKKMSRRNVIRYTLAGLLLGIAGGVLAQYALEIIALRYRTAMQVLPALQPLLERGATLTGQGSRLIVRTSPANLAELRRALLELDRPARRLLISVRFDDSFEGSQRDLGGSARIGSGGSHVEIRARDSRTGADERVDQRVQAVEGAPATIYTGQSRPVREQRYIQTPAGVVSQQTTVVQESSTDFEIVPRISGDRAEVDVLASRHMDAASEGRIATRASGALGQWFLLGALAGESRRIWIRLDPLP